MTRSTQTIVLAFSPDLAAQVGLNEAIFISQMTYWLSKTKHIIQGKPWIYNSYDAWENQFPFWSKSTIRRLIASLEEKGVILSQNFNVRKTNRTKWYSLDLDKIPDSHSKRQISQRKEEPIPSDQNDQSDAFNLNTSINNDTKNTLQKMKERIVVKFDNFKPAKNIDSCKNKKFLEEWDLSKEERLQTLQKFSWDEEKIENELRRFKTYYSNKNADTKKKWEPIWRMWCARAQNFSMERHKRLKNSGRISLFEEKTSEDLVKKFTQERDKEMMLEKELHQWLSKDTIAQPFYKTENTLEPKNEVWLNVSKFLIKEVGAGAYTSWLKDVHIETIKNDSVVIKVKNRFSADYISANFLDKIKNGFKYVLSQCIHVSVIA